VAPRVPRRGCLHRQLAFTEELCFAPWHQVHDHPILARTLASNVGELADFIGQELAFEDDESIEIAGFNGRRVRVAAAQVDAADASGKRGFECPNRLGENLVDVRVVRLTKKLGLQYVVVAYLQNQRDPTES
jgi:hypothetical protein